MTHDTTAPAAPAGPPGLATRLVTRLLFRPAEVTHNQRLAPGLHRIGLAGPALRGLAWAPGDKLQLQLGGGLKTRTYTPICWDAQAGSTQLLAHALAPGPGSEWVRRAQPGQQVRVFGPRRSLDLAAWDPAHAVVVGDETTLGLAAAWRPAHTLLEADHACALHDLLHGLHLHAAVIPRQPRDQHLPTLTATLLGLVEPGMQVVLAGRARTLQHLLRALRGAGMGASRIRTKAYWADGKMGLD